MHVCLSRNLILHKQLYSNGIGHLFGVVSQLLPILTSRANNSKSFLLVVQVAPASTNGAAMKVRVCTVDRKLNLNLEQEIYILPLEMYQSILA